MTSKMLINARHSEEMRVAILEDGILQELEVEYSGREEIKGNVYKGLVSKMQPSIHALFVDFGGNKHGFLPFTEVHPVCYGRDKYVEGKSKGAKPTIEKNLKPGDEVIVQVVKEERDNKGAYLTTYISIAGRYLVLMPGSKKGGVSRKIEDEKEREKLKEIVSSLQLPEDIGVIIRTAGMGKAKADLKKDLGSLMRAWQGIKGESKKLKAPAALYREGDIVLRSIRDYFSMDIKEIVVDNQDAYKKAKEFMHLMMPRYQSRVRLHKENIPLFSKHNVEDQIEAIYSNSVSLKSGGSIVIDPTEALVSIDVNSGRSKGEKNIEDTAFKTNMEAAEEVARQLRLRDLGGLVVIDFIDMRQKTNISQVEKLLKASLKRDKARIDVGRISKFGLMEMSRQRIRSSLLERSFVSCPHCAGRGTIKSIESNALHLLRKIHESSMIQNVEKVDILLPEEVANYLHNRKREELLKIERDCAVRIEIKGQSGIPVNSVSVELVKGKATAVELEKSKPKDKPVAKDDAKSEAKDKKPYRRPRNRGGYQGGRRAGKPESQSSDRPAGESVKPVDGEAKKPSGKGLLGRIKSAIKGD
ncbi:MAG: ribonuclease E/G [Proteobacteria bacterium]|nr:ribonuclease E/G [Pseudomonadota bacterium]